MTSRRGSWSTVGGGRHQTRRTVTSPAARALATVPPGQAATCRGGTARTSGQRARIRDWVALTKPRVISLLLFTTVAAMLATGEAYPSAWTIVSTIIGGYASAGSAHAINNYLERDLDGRMSRTRSRPVPSGRISPRAALAFGVGLGIAAFGILAIAVNLLAAGLAMAGLLTYVFVYTIWLKPSTPQSIVIGGCAGAFPPLVGWAATTGRLTLGAALLFSIVYVWTPPHFWSLALLIRDDYAGAGVPMLPVVSGEDLTRRRILQYCVLLAIVAILPSVFGQYGIVYAAVAASLNVAMIALAADLWARPTRRRARMLYLFSLLYLALLFAAMVVDTALRS